MKERPIIFNTDMVMAILEGRKTMTRRPVKPQVINPIFIDGKLIETGNDDTKHFEIACPFGKTGDLLYVRETFGLTKYDELCFRADAEEFENADGWIEEPKWKPSIHMPKKYARIWIKITDVRVERIQSTSEEDARKEGICYLSEFKGDADVTDFAELWDDIYKKQGYGWDENPWVWVVEFERIK